jgi:hypothetical protein
VHANNIRNLCLNLARSITLTFDKSNKYIRVASFGGEIEKMRAPTIAILALALVASASLIDHVNAEPRREELQQRFASPQVYRDDNDAIFAQDVRRLQKNKDTDAPTKQPTLSPTKRPTQKPTKKDKKKDKETLSPTPRAEPGTSPVGSPGIGPGGSTDEDESEGGVPVSILVGVGVVGFLAAFTLFSSLSRRESNGNGGDGGGPRKGSPGFRKRSIQKLGNIVMAREFQSPRMQRSPPTPNPLYIQASPMVQDTARTQPDQQPFVLWNQPQQQQGMFTNKPGTLTSKPGTLRSKPGTLRSQPGTMENNAWADAADNPLAESTVIPSVTGRFRSLLLPMWGDRSVLGRTALPKRSNQMDTQNLVGGAVGGAVGGGGIISRWRGSITNISDRFRSLLNTGPVPQRDIPSALPFSSPQVASASPMAALGRTPTGSSATSQTAIKATGASVKRVMTTESSGGVAAARKQRQKEAIRAQAKKQNRITDIL